MGGAMASLAAEMTPYMSAAMGVLCPFTGRETLLAEVREWLLARNEAVVQSLHWMGGVGETRLAVEYAHWFGQL